MTACADCPYLSDGGVKRDRCCREDRAAQQALAGTGTRAALASQIATGLLLKPGLMQQVGVKRIVPAGETTRQQKRWLKRKGNRA